MATETARFDVDDYRDDLERAPTNFEVGTQLLFENEAIRVWELRLAPGVCIDGGRAVQRFPDGTMLHVEFDSKDTDFLNDARLETERIHDLENTGETTFRFHTFELLR